jgi:hypothetical protein
MTPARPAFIRGDVREVHKLPSPAWGTILSTTSANPSWIGRVRGLPCEGIPIMPTFPDEEIASVRQRLLENMTSFMRGDGDDSSDAPYSQEHIERCQSIIDTYLAKVPPGSPAPTIRDAVKTAILDLNALNEDCECNLIETGEREDLCQLILVAARRAGLDTDDDITEEWRDW